MHAKSTTLAAGMLMAATLLRVTLGGEASSSSLQNLCCDEGASMTELNETSYECRAPGANKGTAPKMACEQLTSLAWMDYEMKSDGELRLYIDDLLVQYLPSEEFCLANMSESKENDTALTPFICFSESEVRMMGEETVGGCMLLSAIFFFITGVIYLLPELRADVQGKSIVNFSLAFAIALILLAVMRLIAYSHMGLCAARGFFAYFFLMAAFFWMNAISVQLFLSVRRPTSHFLGRGCTAWCPWAGYAWGVPALLTFVAVVINFVEGRHPKPGIGLMHCWFVNSRQEWFYLYGIMSFLTAVNVLIFVYASGLLWRHRFLTSRIKALRYKFCMMLRLLVLMGLPWVFEIIQSLVPKHVVWELLELVNALQGVLIFMVLVVGRRQALRALASHGLLPSCGCLQRHLAGADDEELDVQHTELPMQDRAADT